MTSRTRLLARAAFVAALGSAAVVVADLAPLVRAATQASRLPASQPATRPAATRPVVDQAADLPGFRSVVTAITIRVRPSQSEPGQTGYLGVNIRPDAAGRLVIAELAPDSPADRAGLRKGDVLLKLQGRAVTACQALRDALQAVPPGQEVSLTIERQGKRLDVSAVLAATSRPMHLQTQRAVLGVRLSPPAKPPGMTIDEVVPDMPAARAGLRKGDLIVKLDKAELTNATAFGTSIGQKRPGDPVTLTVRRDGKDSEYRLRLAGDSGGRESRRWSILGTPYWDKSAYRLAAVCVEFPDVKHNAKIALKDWQEALFSLGTYKTDAAGRSVCGSLNDYYDDQSCGAFRIEGKVFDWVEVGKKRMEYSPGSGTVDRSVLLGEALDKLLAREGKDTLKDFDGLFFLYAGERVRTSRGGLYWPHRGTMSHHGKRWGYFICPEGGPRMCGLAVMSHEFGHMLGLPDLYARPENPGSEGAGTWCAMSANPSSTRPQHMSAWCKDRLGWLKPTAIDPTVPQKLVLGPVEGSPRECFKVIIRPDGSEYLLLENRRKKGFDLDLPGEGLLIWRVVGGHPLLEESHGVEGPAGPGVYRDRVPYPSPANDSYTPFTVPSSRSQLGGGLSVHITNIRQLPDGRITFWIGYEFQ